MSDDTDTKKRMDELKRSVIFGERYDVGYRKPPVATRFQKGQSGNPGGRKPKSHINSIEESGPMREMFLEAARRKIKVKDGEVTREITTLQGIIRSQQQAALRGNPLAQRDIIDRTERMLAAEAREIDEINERVRAYQQDCWERIAAKKNKQPEPEFDIHPDDIVIEVGKRVRYIGPVGSAAIALMKENIAFRDACLLQAGLDHKLYPDDDKKPWRERRRSALLMAIMMNNQLPIRVRYSEYKLTDVYERCLSMPKRRLLKAVRQAWRELHPNPKRGVAFPIAGPMVDELTKWMERGKQILADLERKEQASHD